VSNAPSVLRLGVGHKHFPHRVAPACAIEKGFFATERIEATITVTGQDDNTVSGLRDGSLDIALDVSPAKVLAAHATDPGLVLIGAMVNGIHQVLVAAKTVETVEQLRGKRINVVESGTGVDWHPLRLFLRRRGIDPERDVTLVYKAPYPLFENARRTFENDEADARMILHSERDKAIDAGYPVLHDFLTEYPMDYPQRSIVTTRAFLDHASDRVQGFLRAMIRAYRFLREEANYPEVMTIVRKHVKEPNLGLPPSFNEDSLKKPYLGFRQMPPDVSFSVAGLQRYIDDEKATGRLKGDIHAADVSDLRPVQAAAHEVNERFGAVEYA
jgi:ABC-type nitrate/sulfonate/bicarbonate transport system substrate-binding protein